MIFFLPKKTFYNGHLNPKRIPTLVCGLIQYIFTFLRMCFFTVTSFKRYCHGEDVARLSTIWIIADLTIGLISRYAQHPHIYWSQGHPLSLLTLHLANIPLVLNLGQTTHFPKMAFTHVRRGTKDQVSFYNKALNTSHTTWQQFRPWSGILYEELIEEMGEKIHYESFPWSHEITGYFPYVCISCALWGGSTGMELGGKHGWGGA